MQLLLKHPAVRFGGRLYRQQVSVQALHTGVQRTLGTSYGLMPDYLSCLQEKRTYRRDEERRSQYQDDNGQSGGEVMEPNLLHRHPPFSFPLPTCLSGR